MNANIARKLWKQIWKTFVLRTIYPLGFDLSPQVAVTGDKTDVSLARVDMLQLTCCRCGSHSLHLHNQPLQGPLHTHQGDSAGGWPWEHKSQQSGAGASSARLCRGFLLVQQFQPAAATCCVTMATIDSTEIETIQGLTLQASERFTSSSAECRQIDEEKWSNISFNVWLSALG